MKVKITRPGKYADMNGMVRRYEAGEVLYTRAWYAQSIIASGYAVLALESSPMPDDAPPPPEAQPEQDAPAEAAVERWTHLPGVTKKLDIALHEAGIDTQSKMLDALNDGSLINIVGLKCYVKIKQFYEAA